MATGGNEPDPQPGGAANLTTYSETSTDTFSFNS